MLGLVRAQRGFAPAVLLLACESVFGIEPLPAGHGGAGAGTSSVAASGGQTSSGIAGETNSGGSPSGGASAASGSGDDGGSTPGGAGGGGDGPDPDPGAVLDTPCAIEGARACSAGSAHLVLQCQRERGSEGEGGQAGDRGVVPLAWRLQEACAVDARCDAKSPGCRQLNEFCFRYAWQGPTCMGDLAWNCGPDVTEAVMLECPFGCRDGECWPGSVEQMIVHTDSGPDHPAHWSFDTPVCFAAVPESSGNSELELRAIVREEVEQRLGRWIRPFFTGWQTCAALGPGIRIEFASECRGRLVNAIGQGNPDSEVPLRVEICKSYFPPGADTAVTANEALIRYLARHQFGHLLGLYDGKGPSTMMQRGVELGRVDALQPTAVDLARLLSQNFSKPPASFVTRSGKCLGTAGSQVVSGDCRGEAAQQWTHLDRRVRSRGSISPLCLRAEPDAPATIADCAGSAPELDFEIADAQWISAGSCVAPRAGSAATGAPLELRSCGEPGDPRQTWRPAILLYDPGNGYDAQLRFGSTGQCATITGGVATALATLELAPCVATNAAQIFRLSPLGVIQAGSQCLRWFEPDGAIYLGACSYTMGEYQWSFQGSLRNLAGITLSAPASGASGPAIGVRLDGAPGSDEIFGIYF